MPPKRRGFVDSDDEDEPQPSKRANRTTPIKAAQKRPDTATPRKKDVGSVFTADHLMDGPERGNEFDDDDEGRIDYAALDDEELMKIQIPPAFDPDCNADAKKGRLVIQRIDVENFKSYRDKTTIGPFHTNYTSIIGPNGSGKSNVIDALLFVFGFKASRIRTKNVGVLIHNSAGHDNLTFCSVEIFFTKVIDKENGFDEAPNSRFSICRTAYKSNKSEYEITENGRTMKNVKLSVVAEKLKSVGIDLKHNRFLILQGEVEQIAMMPPKGDDKKKTEGMLEYLEDIIGTSRYKEPLQLLETKIAAVDEQLTNQSRMLSNATKEKDLLEGPVNEMMEIMKLENRISYHKNQLEQMTRLKLKNKITKLKETDLVEAQKSEDLAKEELKALNELMQEKNSKTAQLTKENKKLQTKCDRVTDELQQQRQRAGKRLNDIKNKKAEVKKAQAELATLKKKYAELESAPETARDKVQRQREIIEEAEKDEADCQRRLEENQDDYLERTAKDRKEKTTLEEELGVAEQKVTELDGKTGRYRVELQGLTDGVERSKQQYEQTKAKKEEQEALVKRKTEELEEVQQQLPNAEAKLTEKRKRQQELKAEEDVVNREFNKLRNQRYEEQQRFQRGATGSKMMQRLMALKANGTLPGVIARLGDLGGIDQEYDIAVSTASGAWDNVVVEDVPTSTKVFQICREEKLGVVHCICLDKIQHLTQRMEQQRQYPENMPRLFDLIKINDQRMRVAFYHAVQETLVATDSNQAARTSRFNGQRYRVVTKDGALFETSGVLSGGGKPKQGALGKDAKVDSTGESEKTLRTLQKNLDDKQKQLDELRGELQELDTDIPGLSARYKDLKSKASTLEIDISNAEPLLNNYTKSLKDAEARMKQIENEVDATKVEELERKMAKAKKEHADAVEIADKCRAKVKAVDARINAVRADLLTRWEDDRNEAQKKRTDAEATIAKENAALNRVDTNIKKNLTRQKETEADIAQREGEIEVLEKEKDQGGDDEEELNQQKKEFEDRMKEIAEELKELNAKNDEQNRREVELGTRIKDLSGEVQVIKAEIAQAQKQIKQTEENRAKLPTHDITGLGIDQSKMDIDGDDLVKKRKFLIDIDDDDRALRQNLDLDIPMEEGEDEAAYRQRCADIERQVDDRQLRLQNECEDKRRRLEEEISADEKARRAQREQECQHPLMTGHMPEYSDEEVAAFKEADIDFKIKAYEQQNMQGKVQLNLGIVEDYKRKLQRYTAEVHKVEQIRSVVVKFKSKYQELNTCRLTEFTRSFQRIKEYVEQMYQMLTIGGNAQLQIKDTIRPFEHGIQYLVRPPKKTWKKIQNLSGGEKTLSSLALVFALHKFRPTPLYFMDEIDAALDFRNVSIIGHYVKERTKNAQFIIISLRNNMFELSDRLVGIYKVDDKTRHIVVEPSGVYEKASIKQKVVQRVAGKESAPTVRNN
ncbi:unnamed protein product, partial [Mesorhabditis spiculigera]